MPIYDYKCPTCGIQQRAFRKVDERANGPFCANQHHAVSTYKVITAATVRGDYPGYDCPVTGQWIEGRRAHEENLRKRGARVLEPGETDAYKRGVAAEEALFEKEVGQTVEAAIEAMPGPKREQLAVELTSGADVVTQRATKER